MLKIVVWGGVFALAAAGCGSTRTVTVTVTNAVTTTPPPNMQGPATTTTPYSVLGDIRPCTVFRSRSSEYLIVRGGEASALCSRIIREWSGELAFWTRFGQRTSDDTEVCVMVSATGMQIQIYDDLGQDNATEDCARLASAGWVQVA